jgi:hypothetical protein
MYDAPPARGVLDRIRGTWKENGTRVRYPSYKSFRLPWDTLFGNPLILDTKAFSLKRSSFSFLSSSILRITDSSVFKVCK